MNEPESAPSPSDQKERSVAVCLSGGGHRATLFGLGALMYLADAGVSRHVTSIASVSGGSLTNGYLGQTGDFGSTSGADFEEDVARPLASQIANRGTLFAPWATKIYLLLLVVGALAVLTSPWWVSGPVWLRVVMFMVLLWVWGWVLGKRGAVCAHAFEVTLFSPAGRATLLSQLSEGTHNVICATELRSAGQLYFARDFVYSYMFGHGPPDDLTLARAVQASADFPGGFPPVRIPIDPDRFEGAPEDGGPPKPPRSLVLSDGGVYDNMGDQWARGFGQRVRRWKELGDRHPAPTQLVVVNSSARVPWSQFRRRAIPLIGEIAALKRVNDVLYINTTNVRRQDIVASFDPFHPDRIRGLAATLIQITQSPFVVADAFSKAGGPVGDRARAVIAALGEDQRDEWKQIARDDAAVATTLSKLGREVSARLVYHGYVVAMCNLYVIFGADDEYPLLPTPHLRRFQDLVA